MSHHVQDTALICMVTRSLLLSQNVGKWVVSMISLGREAASISADMYDLCLWQM